MKNDDKEEEFIKYDDDTEPSGDYEKEEEKDEKSDLD